jgi:hypothetical protein
LRQWPQRTFSACGLFIACPFAIASSADGRGQVAKDVGVGGFPTVYVFFVEVKVIKSGNP